MQYGMSSLRESPAGPDPLRKKKPAEPGASDSGAPTAAASGIRQPAGQPGSQPAPMSQAPTFAQLQSQGIARPAPPPMMAPAAPGAQGPEAMVNAVLGYGGGSPSTPQGMLGQLNGASGPARTMAGNPGAPSYSVSPDGGGIGGPTPTPNGQTPLPGSSGGNPGSPLDPKITDAILGWLSNPQGYSSEAFNADVEKAYNGIDDEYALNQKHLADNLASRGLGTSDDSSIGLGKMSDLNVGRKSSKSEVLGRLSSDREKRFGTDFQNAVNAALGYNQQLYGNDYLGKQIGVQTRQAVLQALSSGNLDPAIAELLTNWLNESGG